MDRNVLKRILREQFTPFEQAVSQKLEYLSSDKYSQGSESLLSEDCIDCWQDDNNKSTIIEPDNTEDKIILHKKSLTEKINALRGISTPPGSYIHNFR